MDYNITLSDLGRIHDVACSDWKNKIREYSSLYKDDPFFGEEVRLPESVVEEMFRAARGSQLTLLQEIFPGFTVVSRNPLKGYLTLGHVVRLNELLFGSEMFIKMGRYNPISIGRMDLVEASLYVPFPTKVTLHNLGDVFSGSILSFTVVPEKVSFKWGDSTCQSIFKSSPDLRTLEGIYKVLASNSESEVISMSIDLIKTLENGDEILASHLGEINRISENIRPASLRGTEIRRLFEDLNIRAFIRSKLVPKNLSHLKDRCLWFSSDTEIILHKISGPFPADTSQGTLIEFRRR